MRWLRLLLIFLLVPLAGCALNARPSTYLVQSKGPYTLDTGDIVRVSVYGETELSTTYRVDDGGSVSLPLVGAVPVRGLTTQMAAANITAALADGYIREPSVAVQIDTYRPFFIQGAVKSAGQFAYVYGMTVRAAISTAERYYPGLMRMMFGGNTPADAVYLCELDTEGAEATAESERTDQQDKTPAKKRKPRARKATKPEQQAPHPADDQSEAGGEGTKAA